MGVIKNNITKKVNNFYQAQQKKSFFWKWLIFITTLLTLITSFTAYFFTPGTVPYFLHFTRVSNLLVLLWYGFYLIGNYFKLKGFLIFLNSLFVKGFVVYSISLTSFVWMFLIFPTEVITLISLRFDNIILYWVVTVFLHIIIPAFVWIDFRTSTEYNIDNFKKNRLIYYSVTTFLISIYGLSIGIYLLVSGIFPYSYLSVLLEYIGIVVFFVFVFLFIVFTIMWLVQLKYKQTMLVDVKQFYKNISI